MSWRGRKQRRRLGGTLERRRRERAFRRKALDWYQPDPTRFARENAHLMAGILASALGQHDAAGQHLARYAAGLVDRLT